MDNTEQIKVKKHYHLIWFNFDTDLEPAHNRANWDLVDSFVNGVKQSDGEKVNELDIFAELLSRNMRTKDPFLCISVVKNYCIMLEESLQNNIPFETGVMTLVLKEKNNDKIN